MLSVWLMTCGKFKVKLGHNTIMPYNMCFGLMIRFLAFLRYDSNRSYSSKSDFRSVPGHHTSEID